VQYDTKVMTAAPADPDRERLLQIAVNRLRSASPQEVERALRLSHGAFPAVARAVVQQAMIKLRQSGGEIYRPDEGTRIPGAFERRVPKSHSDVDDQ
jgi:hypothetical protein